MGRALTFLIVLAVAASPAAAGPYGARRRALDIAPAVVRAAKKSRGDCGTRVANKVFRCSVRVEGGGTFTDCFRFTSPGAVSEKFDLTPDQLGTTLGCTCKAKGKSRRPKFNASPAFACMGDQDGSFEGTVSGNGKKIGNGFASNVVGTSFVFDCTLDPACMPQ